jgi:hypothetical protein
VLYRFIRWAIRRSYLGTGKFAAIVGDHGWTARRYCPLFPDHPQATNPFNIVLHRWIRSDTGTMHDHPRWSITIVLRGTGWEVTPWGKKRLKPGKIIIRSHKYIHRIETDTPGKLWTLFIVGRWKHEQNLYQILNHCNN